MNSSLSKFFSYNFGVTITEENVIEEDARCVICGKSITNFPAYTCTSSTIFYMHKTCVESLILICFHKHPLRLQKDVAVKDDGSCYVCNTPVTGYPIYTCATRIGDDCDDLCLHKECAELPEQIDHHKHSIHPLSLISRPDGFDCYDCGRSTKGCYTCDDCDFDVCVLCPFEERVLHHEGHKEHPLTLMNKEALFGCDACHEEAKDSSYVCTTCEFWIHKSCAISPSIIPTPTYHHHPLELVYSIPDIHRYFKRYCSICNEYVYRGCWVYYCHKCTYFVHMKCSTSTVSMVDENEEDDIDNEPDLVQFPLSSLESIFDLIVTQCGKFQADFKGKVEMSITISAPPNDLHMIEKHWSHKNHPLQQLHFTVNESDNDDNDNDDRRVLICDGCIQPITVSHPWYYACIECGFFLHSFCATKLPQELPVGASSFHANHSLLLRKRDRFYSFVECGVCGLLTNGFYYQCQTCDINIDVCCAFLPTRIKYKPHKHHSLVQRPSSGKSVYACETCSSFELNVCSAILPSRMEHKYDIHPITLRYPPFFYEGVFYCEICEEQVDNQVILYHCSKSDHSFHSDCFSLHTNVKFGGTIVLSIMDEPHTCALVYKMSRRRNLSYYCSKCAISYFSCYFLECDGCGYLVCYKCVMKDLGE